VVRRVGHHDVAGAERFRIEGLGLVELDAAAAGEDLPTAGALLAVLEARQRPEVALLVVVEAVLVAEDLVDRVGVAVEDLRRERVVDEALACVRCRGWN
jgi:hypothetical protein